MPRRRSTKKPATPPPPSDDSGSEVGEEIDVDALQERIEELQEENESLAKKVEEAEHSSELGKRKFAAASEEMHDLKTKLAAAEESAQSHAVLDEENKSLKIRLIEAKDVVSKLENKLKDSDDKIQSLAKQLKNTEDVQKQFADFRAAAADQNARLTKEVEDLNAKLHAAQRKSQASEASDRGKLMQTINSLRASLRAATANFSVVRSDKETDVVVAKSSAPVVKLPETTGFEQSAPTRAAPKDMTALKPQPSAQALEAARIAHGAADEPW